MSKKKTKEVLPVRLGAVLYTDGSAQPNPGYGGYGITGYTYDLNKPFDPPASQKKNIPTQFGYLPKHEIDGELVKAFRKMDTITMYGSAPTKAIVNNNQMELLALKKAFEYIQKSPFEQTTILSDSQSALNSMGHWYERWEKNGWMNSKGEQVKMKEEIISTWQEKLKAEAKCPSITLKYVKGHSGDLGNDKADKLAKQGSNLHRHGKLVHVEETGMDASKTKVDYHHFFSKHRWYFVGGREGVMSTPRFEDWYVYFIGVLGHQKKDEDFGVRAGDGVSSIVLLKEEEPILKKVEDIYRRSVKHDYNYVVCGRLDTVLTPAKYHEIEQDNLDMIIDDTVGKTLMLPDGKVICMEYNPAHLSYIQMDRYRALLDFAKHYTTKAWEEKGSMVRLLDITDKLVERIEKPKGKDKTEVTYRIQPYFTSANKMKVKLPYAQGDVTKDIDVWLTGQVDMPDKVHLGKMIKTDGEKCRIYVITYRNPGDTFDHCVVVDNGEALGFWMNFNSSIVFVR